jgi:ABC-type phosphate/phosphonate transport system ATPase subunit
MFQISNYNFSFPDSINIIAKSNLNIQAGQRYAILGSNGVGKTTVLESIWGRSFDTTNTTVQLSNQKPYLDKACQLHSIYRHKGHTLNL